MFDTQETYVVAYNAGPGTLCYPGPRDGSTSDLILHPWKHVIVPEYFQHDAVFRRDAKNGKFTVEQVNDLPLDTHGQIAEQYQDLLSPESKQMVLRVCSEEYKSDSRGMNMYRDLINLPDQIGPNGRPSGQSKVTVKYLKETHRYFLEAALELEQRWQKRKAVVRDLKAALRKIDNL